MTQRSERTALGAVAQHLAAACDRSRGAGDASLTVAGKRIALEVVAIRPEAAIASRTMKPRLRLDKVALGLVDRLRVALEGCVPDDRTIIVTITAPIRLASKTAAAMAGSIRRRLEHRAAAGRSIHRIHGNTIQIWILPGGTAMTSKLVGFVHNPDANPRILIEVTRVLLAAIGAHRRAATRRSGTRWLVITDQNELVPIDTYGNVCAQLRLGTVFEQIFVSACGGRVERLSRRSPHDCGG
jgi:hypothetical protein